MGVADIFPVFSRASPTTLSPNPRSHNGRGGAAAVFPIPFPRLRGMGRGWGLTVRSFLTYPYKQGMGVDGMSSRCETLTLP